MAMSAISITTFSRLWPKHSRGLNVEWIEHLFRLEDSDVKVLRDPQSSIIATGGQIFFAVDGNEVVGTVAALRESPTVFELAKMAVQASHQARRGRSPGQGGHHLRSRAAGGADVSRDEQPAGERDSAVSAARICACHTRPSVAIRAFERYMELRCVSDRLRE